MIFITVGSQKFQFDRLLIEVDNAIDKGLIEDDVFAQTGYCTYKPKNFKYKDFLDRQEFLSIMKKCDTVITHGGTGAIMSGIKNGKKVIAVPRLKKFGEHVDDHQLQIIGEFEKMGFIKGVYSIDKISETLKECKNSKVKKYESNTMAIINSIKRFIGEA